MGNELRTSNSNAVQIGRCFEAVNFGHKA